MAPQTTATSHVVKHAPWKTAAPAASILLDGPSATSMAFPRAESSVSSTGGSYTDPVRSSMDDPRNSHETMIQSTEPSGPNGHPGDRGTQADPDPPSQQSSPPIDYELDYQPVYNVKEEKLTPGGPAVTVDGVKYSLDASATALLSDSQTIPLGSPTKLIPSLIIDQQTLSADSAFVYRIGGQNLNPGGPAIAISGTSYSLAASATALLVGSSTVPLGSARPAPPPIPINGEIYTADTRPRLKFKGSKIVAGGAPVTINDVPYALDLSATALYIGSRTIAVSSLMQQQQQQPSGQSQPADEGGLAPAIIGSSTTPTAKQKPPKIININSTPYTANAASAFIIGTQTLAPGRPAITINSTRYSLPPLLPASSSSSSSSSTPTAPQIQAAITVNATLYTCRQNTPCTIASQVLHPNGTITVGAETLVYREGGIDVISATAVVEAPSSMPVITSHISGLTPLGPETVMTVAAAGTGTGKDEESGVAAKDVRGWRLWMLVVVVVGVGVGLGGPVV